MAKRKRGYSLYFNKQRNRYVGQLKCEFQKLLRQDQG